MVDLKYSNPSIARTSKLLKNRLEIIAAAAPNSSTNITDGTNSTFLATVAAKAYLRVFCCFSSGGTLSALIGDANPMKIGPDAGLTAGQLYVFDVPINDVNPMSFRWSGGGNIYLFRLDEHLG